MHKRNNTYLIDMKHQVRLKDGIKKQALIFYNYLCETSLYTLNVPIQYLCLSYLVELMN